MKFTHGGDIYRNKVDYDFSVNANPLGMPEGSREAAERGISLCVNYPDALGEKLCAAIAETEKIAARQVILGNGAAELIYAICRAIEGKVNGLLISPSFQEYENAVRSVSGNVMFCKLNEEDNFRLQTDFCSHITDETSVIFLCNPNNPTGNLTKRRLLEEIAERCEDTKTFLCIDECFLPFVEEEAQYTMKNRIESFPHLIVLRAFTKIYGMPGLRLGYALTSNIKFMERLQACIPPWNTSIPAQMAGLAALHDREYINRTRQLIKQEKEYLIRELSDVQGIKIYASEANYLFFKSRKDLQQLLLRKKILIRACGNYRNLSDEYFRIAVRTHGENKELVRRLKEVEKG